ncbi:transcription factor Zn, C2H [Marssonina coronariae]|uniref:Transcription factor Zn, C2H n=1 Tax=Diplocarpon coronariae TaxID=2795749 RepID=A0A218ZA57_9HELO|nr:transcription factor Zn, C2H [Marssonina coronariae]
MFAANSQRRRVPQPSTTLVSYNDIIGGIGTGIGFGIGIGIGIGTGIGNGITFICINVNFSITLLTLFLLFLLLLLLLPLLGPAHLDLPQSRRHASLESLSVQRAIVNGQQTSQSSTTRAHHRDSSLSSLGSAGPASPYTAASPYNPHVVGDVYHAYQEYTLPSSAQPLTPAHTPSRESFLVPSYPHFYHPNANLAYSTMAHDVISKQAGGLELLAAPEFAPSGRPSLSAAAPPATPPSYEEERPMSGETARGDPGLSGYLPPGDYDAHRTAAARSTAPKLERTMTDVYSDELYNPNFRITSAPAAPATSNLTPNTLLPPQHDIFVQRLEAAQSQHLRASGQAPLTIPSRERSPFRHGSPLAPQPASAAFGGSVQQLRQRRKQERDREIYQQHVGRLSAAQPAPKTISPKEVDLQYHESEDDAHTPLFPPPPGQPPPPSYGTPPGGAPDPAEGDDASPPSYASMATARRESASQPGRFDRAAPPAVAGPARPVPQQYPFVPSARRQPSNVSSMGDDFPSTLTSMESSSSEYAPEAPGLPRPLGAAADRGTYTCTYHGCPLRFDSPAKLQKHKREGHRGSASASAAAAIGSGEGGAMTSAAQRNSQAGPHKCERINPSTGKPCNTIFSRPYDLTRHEDTIHNAGKVKVQCPRCSEEKTFSRNDALTRHLRVVHPDYIDPTKGRRRAGHD